MVYYYNKSISILCDAMYIYVIYIYIRKVNWKHQYDGYKFIV